MGLIPVDAEYHYVQDTAPTTANAGDVWLDTSQNPPVAKIYADVGAGLEWLQDQSSDRIETNLDAPVSEAGQGVDWASKTFRIDHYGGPYGEGTIASISGSGYITSLSTNFPGKLEINIDGTTEVAESDLQTSLASGSEITLFRRFESGFELIDRETDGSVIVTVNYALD